MAVRITQDRAAQIMQSIRSLTRDRVLVGIPSTTAERKPDEDEGAPLNNAEIGYIHEFGAPEANIPARPFLVPGVRNAEAAIAHQLRAGALAALDGNLEGTEARMAAAGQAAVNGVVEKITTGPFAPLAPYTLERRKAKGRTGEKPLLDTGQLRRSITYVIRRR